MKKDRTTQIPDDSQFFKSSLSNGGNGGNPNTGSHCVMVAFNGDQTFVRDSKDSGKTTLSFTREEWKAFILGAKNGEFDLP